MDHFGPIRNTIKSTSERIYISVCHFQRQYSLILVILPQDLLIYVYNPNTINQTTQYRVQAIISLVYAFNSLLRIDDILWPYRSSDGLLHGAYVRW